MEARALRMELAGLDASADAVNPDDEDGGHEDLRVPLNVTAWQIPEPSVMIPIGTHAGRKERVTQLLLM